MRKHKFPQGLLLMFCIWSELENSSTGIKYLFTLLPFNFLHVTNLLEWLEVRGNPMTLL